MKSLPPSTVPLLALAAGLLAATPATASEAGQACVHHPAPAGAAAKRLAIIVGNGGYANGVPALPNPTHDADAAAKAMEALGFEVFLSDNADSAALQQCLDQAYAGLNDADVAMLYYSGHGIQIKDENYLVATDAAAGDLKRGFIAVQPIVDALQKGAKATLIFLDACRTNPMAEGGPAGLSVSTGRGLARAEGTQPPEAPGAVQARGLMVAYATSPNAVAQDGTGALSPFTGAFVKAVGTPGYSIQHIMSDVTKAVGEGTDWAQTPWMKSSLTGELKLGGGQTLAEAQSVSDNHAARAQALLDTDGKKEAAIVEALKGLPASPSDAVLKQFPKAYLALYAAVQSRGVSLPLTPGMTQVAVSTKDRVAVYRLSADYQSGEMTLWSASDKTVVAKLPVAGQVSKFLFSPHGNLLAVASGNGVGVWNGVDGTKMFDVRAGRVSSVEFSPDESRLLLVGDEPASLTIVDVASRKPSMVVKAPQLMPAAGKRRAADLVQADFGSNDTICYALDGGQGGKKMLGVFDLRQNMIVRQRETGDAVTVTVCDPAGKYMVRTFAVGADQSGMEIWDLVHDTVTAVKAPIANILGIDPEGNYVSVIAMAADDQGFYDLATGKKGYPPYAPDGFVIYGSQVRNASGGLVSQDINPNAWRDWPDESLFGPALVEKAMAGLSTAARDEVTRERITFTAIAANP